MATNTPRIRDYADTIVTFTGDPFVELNVFSPTSRESRVETTVQLEPDEADRIALQLIRKAQEARLRAASQAAGKEIADETLGNLREAGVIR